MAFTWSLAGLWQEKGRRAAAWTAIFLVAGAVLFPEMSAAAEKVDVREAIVKIFTIRNRPDYTNPWNMFGPSSVNGSGCVIEGNRILTNAHVVSDQTFIQVRLFEWGVPGTPYSIMITRPGASLRFPAFFR